MIAKTTGSVGSRPDHDAMVSATPYEVPPFDLSILRSAVEVASGNVATFYRAKLPSLSAPHAVDVAVRRPRITSQEAIERFETELSVRARLDHPHILPLLAANTSPPHYCTVSPWIAGGDAFDAVHGRGVRFPFSRLLVLARQISEAISHMHARGIVHRGIKSASVLLTASHDRLYVADLDLAIDAEQVLGRASQFRGRVAHGPLSGRLEQMVGTLVYQAPEVLQGSPHSFAADVYALGVTLNELAAGAVPYADRKHKLGTSFNQLQLRAAIMSESLRPTLACSVPPRFARLIEAMWAPEHACRPDAVAVCKELNELSELGEEYLSHFGTTTDDTAVDELTGETQSCLSIDAGVVCDDELSRACAPTVPLCGTPDIDVNAPDVTVSLSSTSDVRNDDHMEVCNVVASPLLPERGIHLLELSEDPPMQDPQLSAVQLLAKQIDAKAAAERVDLTQKIPSPQPQISPRQVPQQMTRALILEAAAAAAAVATIRAGTDALDATPDKERKADGDSVRRAVATVERLKSDSRPSSPPPLSPRASPMRPLSPRASPMRALSPRPSPRVRGSATPITPRVGRLQADAFAPFQVNGSQVRKTASAPNTRRRSLPGRSRSPTEPRSRPVSLRAPRFHSFRESTSALPPTRTTGGRLLTPRSASHTPAGIRSPYFGSRTPAGVQSPRDGARTPNIQRTPSGYGSRSPRERTFSPHSTAERRSFRNLARTARRALSSSTPLAPLASAARGARRALTPNSQGRLAGDFGERGSPRVTTPEPFNLRSAERHERAQRHLEQLRDDAVKRSASFYRPFKAKPMPDFSR